MSGRDHGGGCSIFSTIRPVFPRACRAIHDFVYYYYYYSFAWIIIYIIISSSYSPQIAAAKSSTTAAFHHQSQQQIVVMTPPPTMQTATPQPPSTQASQTSPVVQVNGGGQSLTADRIANMIPVTKRNPKDYIFGKVIGEGSYSTVSIKT